MNADDLRIYWVGPELFSMGGASQFQDIKLLKSLVSRCLPWLHLKCPKTIFGESGCPEAGVAFPFPQHLEFRERGWQEIPS